MKAIQGLNNRAVVALLLGNVGCNGLLDIERHQLAPLSAGDASKSVTSHDGGAQDEETRDEPTQEVPMLDAALYYDASTTVEVENSSERGASVAVESDSGGGQGSTVSFASASGAVSQTAEASAPINSSPADSSSVVVTTEVAPDPRYTTPTDGPNLAVGFGCSSKLDSWGYTSYCRFTPNGFDANGNPLDNVGDVHVWVYWSEASVDGWICLNDNVANGRGLKYQVAAHPTGAPFPTLPADNVTPEGGDWLVVYKGRDNEVFGTCDWVGFSAPQKSDQVMVEWLDLWTSQHFDGRYVIQAP